MLINLDLFPRQRSFSSASSATGMVAMIFLERTSPAKSGSRSSMSVLAKPISVLCRRTVYLLLRSASYFHLLLV